MIEVWDVQGIFLKNRAILPSALAMINFSRVIVAVRWEKIQTLARKRSRKAEREKREEKYPSTDKEEKVIY